MASKQLLQKFIQQTFPRVKFRLPYLRNGMYFNNSIMSCLIQQNNLIINTELNSHPANFIYHSLTNNAIENVVLEGTENVTKENERYIEFDTNFRNIPEYWVRQILDIFKLYGHTENCKLISYEYSNRLMNQIHNIPTTTLVDYLLRKSVENFTNVPLLLKIKEHEKKRFTDFLQWTKDQNLLQFIHSQRIQHFLKTRSFHHCQMDIHLQQNGHQNGLFITSLNAAHSIYMLQSNCIQEYTLHKKLPMECNLHENCEDPLYEYVFFNFSNQVTVENVYQLIFLLDTFGLENQLIMDHYKIMPKIICKI